VVEERYAAVGLINAVIETAPFTEGSQEQETECDEPDPVVGTEMHPAIRLLLAMKITVEARVTLRLMIVDC
jgi:hypothetical protein